MTDLPTFDAVKPIGKCGACGRDMYEHSTPNICGYREDCPMHGERWMQLKMARDMRNAITPALKP